MKLFKYTVSFGVIMLIISGCSTGEMENPKYWSGKRVDLTHLTEVTNTYHMFDTTGSKVGSMIFGWKFQDRKLIARDTSQFDDGSVYETFEMAMDTSDFKLESLSQQMQLGSTSLDLELTKEGEIIKGQYLVKRDTAENLIQVDSSIVHDIFRGEIYMLLHSLNLLETDTIKLTPFIPTSIATAKAQIYREGVEEITVPAGTFKCDVLWLKATGPMPTNKIWISQSRPRKMVKFYVPGPELSIELIDSQKSIF